MCKMVLNLYKENKLKQENALIRLLIQLLPICVLRKSIRLKYPKYNKAEIINQLFIILQDELYQV